MIMNATVKKVRESSLLVCDHATKQEVIVHTEKPCCFRIGQRIRIQFSGAMTMSIPPQISAICITPAGYC